MTVEMEIEKSIQPEVAQLRYLADHTEPNIPTLEITAEVRIDASQSITIII